MQSTIKGQRRRKWKRYKIRGGALVMLSKPSVIKLGKPRLVKFGPILDISMGGLSVQYIDSRQRAVQTAALAIMSPVEGVKVQELPFTVIRDVQMAALPDERIIRVRNVEFGTLKSFQMYQLESFIKTYGYESTNERRTLSDRRQYTDPRFEDPDYAMMNERRFMGERRSNWPPAAAVQVV
jgi:hypothetical protein